MATFISKSAAETEAFGRTVAVEIKKGDVVGLVGELGSGKTQFVKGLAAGVGSSADVTSPTFTLIHEYFGGRLPIYHFDLFRINDQESAERLGFDDYFFGDGICLVEWADKFPMLLPPHTIWMHFKSLSETVREITRTDRSRCR